MQDKVTIVLQDPLNLGYSERYADQICQKASFSEYTMQSSDKLHQLRLESTICISDDLWIPLNREVVPAPRISECLSLSAVFVSDVVVYLVVVSL
jgi:hypothetical protein